MIITPYNNKRSNSLYFRVRLNKTDLNFIEADENCMYQLKCVGATKSIFEIKEIFASENLEFYDRLFPSIPPGERRRKKAEFGIMLSNKLKRSYSIVIKIEFHKNGFIRFRDVYILDRQGHPIEKFIVPRKEYELALELEKIYKLLLELPKKQGLCNTCPYLYEYKANGYCIKYHPDSNIPSDL